MVDVVITPPLWLYPLSPGMYGRQLPFYIIFSVDSYTSPEAILLVGRGLLHSLCMHVHCMCTCTRYLISCLAISVL